MSTGPEHYAEAERLLEFRFHSPEAEAHALAIAQVRATLAQAAATEALAAAVQNIPTYEGMLAVYNFGGKS